jgi:putative endonuclease
MKPGYTYIMSNEWRTTFYIGVTNNLERRVYEHKNHLNKGFTDKYQCTHLVYYEEYWEIAAAIQREKQLKNWHRQWKINLIKEMNPEMKDLAADWTYDPEAFMDD